MPTFRIIATIFLAVTSVCCNLHGGYALGRHLLLRLCSHSVLTDKMCQSDRSLKLIKAEYAPRPPEPQIMGRAVENTTPKDDTRVHLQGHF